MQKKNKENKPVRTERYVPKEYRSQKDPMMAIIISFFIMAAFWGIQLICQLPFAISAGVDAANNAEVTDANLTDLLVNAVDTGKLTLLATIVCCIVSVIWYKMAYCRTIGIKEVEYSCKRIFKIPTTFGIILSAIGMYYLCNHLVSLIGVISPQTIINYEELMNKAGITNLADWRIIITTIIIAPLNEECIMRGLILRRLRSNMYPHVAVMLSAVFFGVFHLNLVQGLFAATAGMFLAYLADKYNSILPSIVFHIVFNGMNFLLYVLPEYFSKSPVINITVPIVAMAGWFLLEGRRKIDKSTDFS